MKAEDLELTHQKSQEEIDREAREKRQKESEAKHFEKMELFVTH